MISCSDIDLVNYIENISPDEEALSHIQQCSHCQAELLQLKQAIDAITPYFDHLLSETILADPQMESLLSDFENKMKDPLVSEIQPLPEKFRKSIRNKRVAARTRHALEKLIGNSERTKRLVKDIIGQTLQGPRTQGAPAARDDLTDAGDENMNDEKNKSSSATDDTDNDQPPKI